ncbi:MAG: class II glutamine amidotransferase [Myxococcales bacterium]|nr:class II glutamine amidotransferase [Myxococcales bacterium]
MCRMFGMLAAQPVSARALLRDAPRSLWTLAAEHPDGWGVAIDDGDGWAVHRDTACAQRSAAFEAVAAATRARVVVAHVRQKTVGATALANTHPFCCGPLVFAHNGTVAHLAALTAQTSAARRAAIVGDTDSERLFAFIATQIDRAGDVERGVRAAVDALHAGGDLGSLNFLLACGRRIYAHRLGRALFALVRHGGDDDRRTATLVVASEPLTDEAWRELPERSLHVLDAVDGAPVVRTL